MRAVRIAVVAGLLGAAPTVAGAAPVPPSSVGPAVRGGDLALVSATSSDHVIRDGVSATIFGLRLPDGATCPGDSAHDQWRIQSFVVPAGVDPGQLTYDEIKPVGDGRWALYDVDTNPYVHVLLEPNAAAGSPGRIAAVPPLSFAVFPPGTLAPGPYRVGLACTYFRQTATFWDTEVVLTADPADQPGQLTWTVPSAPTESGRPGSSRRWLFGGIAAAALTTLAVVVARQRAATNLVKEPA